MAALRFAMWPAMAMRHARQLSTRARRRFTVSACASAPQFEFTDLFKPASPKSTPWRKLTSDGVSTLDVGGQRVLKVGAHRGRWPVGDRPHVLLDSLPDA